MFGTVPSLGDFPLDESELFLMTCKIKICIILFIRRTLGTVLYERISVQVEEPGSNTGWQHFHLRFPASTLFFKITVTESASGELD